MKPTFAQFALDNDVEFGFWAASIASPAPTGPNGSIEICFDHTDLDAMHAHALSLGVTVLMPPTELEFGSCLVLADPDGNRIRFVKE